jgi:hypothetical protein
MSSALFDKSGILFTASWLGRGIEVQARFDAPQLFTGEPGKYTLRMYVDPATRGLSAPQFTFRRKSAKHHTELDPEADYTQGTNDLRKLAEEIRDLFLESPAWPIIKSLTCDPNLTVNQDGRIHVRKRARIAQAKAAGTYQRPAGKRTDKPPRPRRPK